MSNTEALDAIAELTDRLRALEPARRGAPLRADDWNRVVAAVLELAALTGGRTQVVDEALRARFAAREHLHLGAVDASWLDPSTRALLEAGAEGSTAVRNELVGLRAEIAAVRAEVAQVRSQLSGLQTGLHDLDDRDHVRELGRVRLDTKVEGLVGLRQEVLDVRTQIDVINPKVREALEFRDELVGDDGTRVDVGALASRLGDLETFRRDNLSAADGTPLRYRDVEHRVVSLETSTIRTENLDEAIASRLREGQLVDIDGLRTQVLEAADERIGLRMGDLRSDIDLVREEVETVRTRVDEEAASTADVRVRLGQGEARLSLMEPVPGRVAELTTRIGAAEGRHADVASRVDGLTATASRVELLSQQIDVLAQLPGRLAFVEERTEVNSAAVARVEQHDARLTAVEALRPEVDAMRTRVDSVDRRSAANEAEISKVSTRMTVAESRADDVDTRFTKVEDSNVAFRREFERTSFERPGRVINR